MTLEPGDCILVPLAPARDDMDEIQETPAAGGDCEDRSGGSDPVA